MKQARENRFPAKGHRELQVLGEGNALDLQVDGIGVVVEPNVAFADLVFASGFEEHESEPGYLGDEGEVRTAGCRPVPALRPCGGREEHQGEQCNDEPHGRSVVALTLAAYGRVRLRHFRRAGV